MFFDIGHHSIINQVNEFTGYNKRPSNFSDDASTSSTITVDRQAKALAQTKTARRTRRVHFDLDRNELHDNTTGLCQEEVHDLWYSGTEFRYFKDYTHALAQHICEAEQKSTSVNSYQRVLERTYDACTFPMSSIDENDIGVVLSPQNRQGLNHWAQIAPGRLGLEKWTIRRVSREKSARRCELVDVVLDLQDFIPNSQADKDECIRQSCIRISRPSRLFALCIGQAQACAIEQETCSALKAGGNGFHR